MPSYRALDVRMRAMSGSGAGQACRADAYYRRGLVEQKIGKTAEADADIQKAKEIDPYIEQE